MPFFKKFLNETSGNVAMMFVAGSVAIMASVGLAIDYSGMRDAHMELQGQVDSAVLALARSNVETHEERVSLAHAAMLANGYDPDAPPPIVTVSDEGVVTVHTTEVYDAMIMGMFGHSSNNISALAESQLGGGIPIELALVLDTTESMRGDKMAALVTAATGLIEDFEETENEDVSISLVPFSNYVNVDSVGMNNRSASWITVPVDWSETETYTPRTRIADGYCRGVNVPVTYVVDGVTRTKNQCDDWVGHTYEYGSETTRIVNHTWNGCVGSRDMDLHLVDGSYGTRVPGFLDVSCAAPIVPLTNDFETLATAVQNLGVGHSTYMPTGLIWGQRVLSAFTPYDEGTVDPKTQKVLVLMTDGMNTMALHSDGTHHNKDLSDTDDMNMVNKTNQDTRELCTRIKSSGIQVFTIAFEVGDGNTKTMLRNCATSSNNFYDAENSDQLLAAFDAIVGQVNLVRLTK